MKFSNSLKLDIVPEWSEKYLSYNELKAAALRLTAADGSSSAEFSIMYKQDIQRVAEFFNSKLRESNHSLQQEIFKQSTFNPVKKGSNGSNGKNNNTLLKNSRDSLIRTVGDVYCDLKDLYDYLSINRTGFLKIIENHSSVSVSGLSDELSLILDKYLPVCELSDLERKMAQVEDVYSCEFCDGSLQNARSALEM